MPRMHTTLGHIQEGLDSLSLDELFLLCGFLRTQLGESPAKHQRPARQKPQSTGNLDRMLEKVPSLSDSDKRALLKVIALLCQALEPQKGRRGGMGSIEIKVIKRGGKGYGPFAYLRYWATGGGWDGTKHVTKSLYLGKEIALAIQSRPETAKTIKEQVLKAVNAGTLDQLKAELRAAQTKC
jgi:hypothetical protein